MPVEMRGNQSPETWMQVVDGLRQTTGVESIALAGWAPLTGNRWRSSVRTEGAAFDPKAPHFVSVSPGYFETMAMTMAHGRDFRPGDTPPRVGDQQQPLAGVGIVNESFAKVYFGSRNPVVNGCTSGRPRTSKPRWRLSASFRMRCTTTCGRRWRRPCMSRSSREAAGCS